MAIIPHAGTINILAHRATGKEEGKMTPLLNKPSYFFFSLFSAFFSFMVLADFFFVSFRLFSPLLIATDPSVRMIKGFDFETPCMVANPLQNVQRNGWLIVTGTI